MAQGKALPNGRTVFEELSKDQSAIKLLYISEEEIESIEALLPDHLETIRETMNDTPGNSSGLFCVKSHIC